MIRRVVLWDIDGTLVRGGDVSAAVFDAAVETVLGQRPVGRPRMSGKTDPQIVVEYLHALGIADPAELMPAVLDQLEANLAAAEAELAATGHACEGAAEVLEALAGDDRVLSSVLTGNIAPNAVVKVAAFGLDRWLDLDVGAYGSDDADRERLVPVALGRIAEQHGVTVAPSDVWVVGDTPRDLACARAGGARCLLVATGRYTAPELRQSGADEVMEHLRDTDRILKVLTGDL
ncbi:MAG: haloacid dehalogenase-like hydrolase [Acidimicrobiaceae bacterium]|nr:haloacid dehalogenase-like hydrolase [Acidimicrobiaceae bacterium]